MRITHTSQHPQHAQVNKYDQVTILGQATRRLKGILDAHPELAMRGTQFVIQGTSKNKGQTGDVQTRTTYVSGNSAQFQVLWLSSKGFHSHPFPFFPTPNPDPPPSTP